jgi:tetratricopeptide (TPR) repeat protein
MLIGLTVVAATPRSQPEDLIRQGNEAFARGDPAAAVEFYTQAEDRADDPGLVAFNKAAALYRLGRYRDAELHYRRAREDATGMRLTRLLCNLGNTLLQQAGEGDAVRLREAIRLYEECLRQSESEESLLAEARHNLELARLLVVRARPGKEGPDPSNPDQEREPGQPNETQNSSGAEGAERMAAANPGGKPQPLSGAQSGKEAAAGQTDQPPPGKGNIPPLPDEDELVPLTPEDAQEHLKQAAARIQQERHEFRRRPTPPPTAKVKNW